MNRVFVEAHREEKLPFICFDCCKLEARRRKRISMNHFLIRDEDSPQAITAESLDEALAQLGLDAADISKAEVMIAGSPA